MPAAMQARSDAPFATMPIGLCEDYPEESRSLALAREDLELMRKAGVDVLRVSLGWDEVEPERGRFDFAFWDAFIRMAVDDFGIRLLPYVAYTPRWAVHPAAQTREDTWRYPPADPGAWSEALRALASRYEKRIGSWELWNEPDNQDYWRGTPAEFAALVKAGAAAVRRGAPQAQVVLGGIAWDTEFLATLFRDERLGDSVDVVNAHAYFETWNASPLEALDDYVHRLRRIVDRWGRGQPVWLAEVGYSSYRDGTHVSAVYDLRYGYEHTLAFQAVMLLRTVAAARATEQVGLLAWYELKDLPPEAPVIGDVNNRHLGVTLANRHPKPALAALVFANTFLGGPLRVRDEAAVVTRAVGSEVVVHVFETPAGALRVVAWLATSTPRSWAWARAPVRDRRGERISLRVPGVQDADSFATLFGTDGRPRGRVPVAHVAGALALPGLVIEPGQVLLLEVKRRAP